MRTGRLNGSSTAVAAALAIGLALAGSGCGGTAGGAGPERIDKTSVHSFDETLARLTAAIRDANLVLVNQVNYTQMLRMVNLETEGLRSLEVFHPRYGGPLFQADRTAGLEVPFRIFVRQDEEGAIVSYYQPSSILAGYSGMGDLAGELDQVFGAFTDRATKR